MERKTITFKCDQCGMKEVRTYAAEEVPNSIQCTDCNTGWMFDVYSKHYERTFEERISEDEMARLLSNCPQCNTHPCICTRPETETFGAGAKRDKEEIPDYRLIPKGPLTRLARRYSHGAVKYGDRNWEQGDAKFAKDCLNRAFEHLLKYTSADMSEDHLAAVLWNIVAVMYFEEKIGSITVDR